MGKEESCLIYLGSVKHFKRVESEYEAWNTFNLGRTPVGYEHNKITIGVITPRGYMSHIDRNERNISQFSSNKTQWLGEMSGKLINPTERGCAFNHELKTGKTAKFRIDGSIDYETGGTTYYLSRAQIDNDVREIADCIASAMVKNGIHAHEIVNGKRVGLKEYNTYVPHPNYVNGRITSHIEPVVFDCGDMDFELVDEFTRTLERRIKELVREEREQVKKESS